MVTETTISKNIRTADVDAEYDAACKKLLSEKIILAWIMKSCLDEYRDCSVKEIMERYIEKEPQVSEVEEVPYGEDSPLIHGVGNEDVSIKEETIRYDIRFFALAPSVGKPIRLILNAEAQSNASPGYPLIKRGIYYCSRMISAQYGTVFRKSQYGKIRKVFSIWVIMHPPKHRRNTITRYSFMEKNLTGNTKEKRENYDLMTIIMICLGGPGKIEDKNYNGILKLLDVLLSRRYKPEEKRKILREEFEIPMTENLERSVYDMCNLSEGVRREGRRSGLKDGRRQGRRQGRIESIRKLNRNLKLSVEQAMEVLEIPEHERAKYAAMLKGR